MNNETKTINQFDEKFFKSPALLRVMGAGKSYFIKTPWWLKKIYPSYTWDIKTDKKSVYLTFDDGPHLQITNFVLDELKRFNAKATFFCIGKNVSANPEIFERIIENGHTVGNHSFNHLNGWRTNDEQYLNDIAEAAKLIDSNLFRPPYGRITSYQAKCLSKAMSTAVPKIVMWSILSGDFDQKLSSEKIINNVIKYAKAGSIIVFHDSEKAFPHLKEILSPILESLQGKGFSFENLNEFQHGGK
jgi:peptidoglycan/xylan/chitin deacetylase (PgdA/CDA1 family)